MFGDPVVATAILDRLLHHSHVVTIRGDGYRLRGEASGGALEGRPGDPARGGAGVMAGVQILMSPLVQFRMSLDRRKPRARCSGTAGAWYSPCRHDRPSGSARHMPGTCGYARPR